MSKITLTDLVNLENQTTAVNAINSNNAVLEAAFDNTLSRDGTSPNTMEAPIDMNSSRILNLPDAVSAQEPATFQQLSTITGGGKVSNIPAGGTTNQALKKNSNADYDISWGTLGTGTVTSVGLTGSADFTITGSPVTGTGNINISHTSTSGTGAMVRATSPTITTPSISGATVDNLNSASAIGIINGGNAQSLNTKSLVTSATYNKTPPTNGIWTDSGVAYAGGTGGSTLVQAASGTASGTLTLPSVTGVLVADTAAQTLTNKTINGASNTISNVNLASQVTGNLPVNNLNSGTSASSSTFWRGDGTWSTPAGGGTVTSVALNGLTITGSGTFPNKFGLVNNGLTCSASAGALTINLVDRFGASPTSTTPVTGYFRTNSGTTSGSWDALAITTALSLVVPSSATIGVASTSAFRIWVVLFNDAGTPRLGVINCAGNNTIFPLTEYQPVSSTAISASSNSSGVFYTGTAVTNKTYLILGFLEWSSSGITAGTWTTTNLLYVQSYGEGIAKPGQPVGNVAVANNVSGSSTSSTSMVDVTGAAVSVAPTSAANRIRIYASGYGQVLAAGSGQNSAYQGQLLRNSTILSGLIQIGVVSASGTNQQSNGGFSHVAYDAPNTTSATTYKLQNATTNASGAAQTYAATVIAEEIMA